MDADELRFWETEDGQKAIEKMGDTAYDDWQSDYHEYPGAGGEAVLCILNEEARSWLVERFVSIRNDWDEDEPVFVATVCETGKETSKGSYTELLIAAVLAVGEIE